MEFKANFLMIMIISYGKYAKPDMKVGRYSEVASYMEFPSIKPN